MGRVALEDVCDPYSAEVIVPAGKEITEEKVRLIEGSGIDRVLIRSVLSCRSRRGVCAACYGRDLGRGHMVNIGEAIGVIAAQSIGEPGTQLTMRTFHIGGTASRSVEQAELKTQRGGTVAFRNLHSVVNAEGVKIVMNRNAEIMILDDLGRERERFKVNYGAQILVKEGCEVEAGTILADWDAYTIPIVAEVGGVIKYGDIIEGVTMQEKVDAVTGKSSKVIIHSSSTAQLNPRVSVKNERGKTLKLSDTDVYARYSLPVGSIISVS